MTAVLTFDENSFFPDKSEPSSRFLRWFLSWEDDEEERRRQFFANKAVPFGERTLWPAGSSLTRNVAAFTQHPVAVKAAAAINRAMTAADYAWEQGADKASGFWQRTAAVRQKAVDLGSAWSRAAVNVARRVPFVVSQVRAGLGYVWENKAEIARKAPGFVVARARASAHHAWTHKSEMFWGGLAGNISRHGTKAIVASFAVAAGVTTLPVILATTMAAGAVAGIATRLVKTYVANRGKSLEERRSYEEGLLSSAVFGVLGTALGAFLFTPSEAEGFVIPSTGSDLHDHLTPAPTGATVQAMADSVFITRLPEDLLKALKEGGIQQDGHFERIKQCFDGLQGKQREKLLTYLAKAAKETDPIERSKHIVRFSKETARVLFEHGKVYDSELMSEAGLVVAASAGAKALNTLDVAQLCGDQAERFIREKNYGEALGNIRQMKETLNLAPGSEEAKQALLEKAENLAKLSDQANPALKPQPHVDAPATGATGANAAQAIVDPMPNSPLPKDLRDLLTTGQVEGLTIDFDHLSSRVQKRLLKITAGLAKTDDPVARSKIISSFCKEFSYELHLKGFENAPRIVEDGGLAFAAKIAKELKSPEIMNTVTNAQLCADLATEQVHSGGEGNIRDAYETLKQGQDMLSKTKCPNALRQKLQKRFESMMAACVRKMPSLAPQPA